MDFIANIINLGHYPTASVLNGDRSGDRARLLPVLCYSEQQNLQNSEAVRKLFWGALINSNQRQQKLAGFPDILKNWHAD